jgi:hypothetical protein
MALFDVSVVDANSQAQAAQMFHVISNQPTLIFSQNKSASTTS